MPILLSWSPSNAMARSADLVVIFEAVDLACCMIASLVTLTIITAAVRRYQVGKVCLWQQAERTSHREEFCPCSLSCVYYLSLCVSRAIQPILSSTSYRRAKIESAILCHTHVYLQCRHVSRHNVSLLGRAPLPKHHRISFGSHSLIS